MAKKTKEKKGKVVKIPSEVFEPMYIMVDRNKLAARSQEIGVMISKNNMKDPDMKDPKIIIENAALQGASNMLIEILDTYGNNTVQTVQSKAWNKTKPTKSKQTKKLKK